MKKTLEIEVGDFVTIVKGENEGWTGILDTEFVHNGVVTFAVVEGEDFYYATEIKLHSKGN
jgi:hypothetical protein